MGRKLIVVLTASWHDWGQISACLTPGSNVAYLDCDQGRITLAPIQGVRVIVIANVQGRKEYATDELCRILSQYDGYNPVVGLHRTPEFTSQCIDKSRLVKDIAIDDKECTTSGLTAYNRLLREIIKKSPDIADISQHFDNLFAAIKDRVPQLYKKVYDHLLAAFLPYHVELQLQDQRQLLDLRSQLQDRYDELERCLHAIGQFLAGSNIQFEAARKHFAKLFQDVQSVQETSSINFEDFHTIYCNLRDNLLSYLEKVEG
jgi:hypothetical protein